MAISNNKAWLEFAAHVAKLEAEGAFVEPSGGFVYSLKERQGRELNRIILRERSTENPAYLDVFSRPDMVDAEDIKFLAENLKSREYLILLKALATKSSEQWLKPGGSWKEPMHSIQPDPQLLASFLSITPAFDAQGDESQIADPYDSYDSFYCSALFDLTGTVLGDRTGEIYGRLEERISGIDHASNQWVKHEIESDLINSIPLAIVMTEGAANTLDSKNYPGNDYPLVKTWLVAYERFKSLPRVGEERDQRLIGQRFQLYMAALPAKTNAYHVPILHKFLTEQLQKSGEAFCEALSQKAPMALLCFGDNQTLADLRNLPSRIFGLVKGVKKSTIDSSLANRLLGLLFIAILNGKRKNMDQHTVDKIMFEVRDDIDWKFCVSKLNAKGRKLLLEHFTETKYYAEYLNVQDRGKKFAQDLGL